MTMTIDPRQGLHRNLNLLEAYKIYEKDYPLFLPDISATLAMNSPLFSRIDETLTLQSLNKTEFEQDEAQLRGAAMAGGVPLDQLRQAFRIFRVPMAAAVGFVPARFCCRTSRNPPPDSFSWSKMN